jgi:nucleotide-binding universal stress UspA family protein
MTATPFARILVGCAPTEQGTDALALGADLAVACGADLLLVSVVTAVWLEHPGEQTGPAVVHSRDRERAASALNEAAGELAGVAGIGHVGRRLEASSSPARGLHDAAVAEHADLVVVGSAHYFSERWTTRRGGRSSLPAGSGPLGRVLLGSVGERLLSGAPCAVAVAPRDHAGHQGRQIRRIAIAFDGSPEARAAVRVARGLASRIDASLHALMVIEPPAAIAGHFVPLPGLEPLVTIERGETLQRQELAARAALDSALHELHDGTIAHDVLFGSDPASAIVDAAGADYDLLVLGSRAYGPVRRTLVGSVSSAVIRRARCPVLVTPRIGEQST